MVAVRVRATCRTTSPFSPARSLRNSPGRVPLDGRAVEALAPRLTVFRREGDVWLVVTHANFAQIAGGPQPLTTLYCARSSPSAKVMA